MVKMNDACRQPIVRMAALGFALLEGHSAPFSAVHSWLSTQQRTWNCPLANWFKSSPRNHGR